MFKRRLSHYSSLSKNLATFLTDASKDVSTTTYRGTLFEYQTMESLHSATTMELSHVGGKSDRGIDLRGTWMNYDVLVQCKNLKTGCSPDHIRELMGTLISSPKRKKTIGILSSVSGRPFTRDVLAHFNSSPVPLGLATVSETTLKSLMFNKPAQRLLKDILITTQFDKQGNESIYIRFPEKKQKKEEEVGS